MAAAAAATTLEERSRLSSPPQELAPSTHTRSQQQRRERRSVAAAAHQQQLLLVERLLDYLGDCISANAAAISEEVRNDTSRTKNAATASLTLPVAAVAWLGTMLYPSSPTPPPVMFEKPMDVDTADAISNNNNKQYPGSSITQETAKQNTTTPTATVTGTTVVSHEQASLLRRLLSHVSRVRITSDPWPLAGGGEVDDDDDVAAAVWHPAAPTTTTTTPRSSHWQSTSSSLPSSFQQQQHKCSCYTLDGRVFPRLQLLWLDDGVIQVVRDFVHFETAATRPRTTTIAAANASRRRRRTFAKHDVNDDDHPNSAGGRTNNNVNNATTDHNNQSCGGSIAAFLVRVVQGAPRTEPCFRVGDDDVSDIVAYGVNDTNTTSETLGVLLASLPSPLPTHRLTPSHLVWSIGSSYQNNPPTLEEEKEEENFQGPSRNSRRRRRNANALENSVAIDVKRLHSMLHAGLQSLTLSHNLLPIQTAADIFGSAKELYDTGSFSNNAVADGDTMLSLAESPPLGSTAAKVERKINSLVLWTELKKLDLSHNRLGTVTNNPVRSTRLSRPRENNLCDDNDHPRADEEEESQEPVALLDLVWRRLATFSSLILLNVSHNHLKTVRGMDQLASLQTLHLEYNSLSDVHLTASTLAVLTNLTSLHLTGNPFSLNTDEDIPSGAAATTSADGIPSRTRSTRLRRFLGRTAMKRPNKPTVPTSASSLPYRIPVLSAFCHRRLAVFPADAVPQLTRRHVQTLLPVLDGTSVTCRELACIEKLTFVPVPFDPLPIPAGVNGGSRFKDTNEVTPSKHAIFMPYHLSIAAALVGGSNNTVTRDLHVQRRVARKAVIQNIDEPPWGFHSTSSSVVSNVSKGVTQQVSYSLADVVVTLTHGDSHASPLSMPLNTGQRNHSDEQSNLKQHQAIIDATEQYHLEENIGQKYLHAIVCDVSWYDNPYTRQKLKSSTSGSTVKLTNTPAALIVLPSVKIAETKLSSTLAKSLVASTGNVSEQKVLSETPVDPGPCKPESAPSMPVKSSVESTEEREDITPEGIDEKVEALTPQKNKPTHLDCSPSIAPTMEGFPTKQVSNSSNSLTSTLSPNSMSSPEKLSLRVVSFSENHWQDDNNSVQSSFSAAAATPTKHEKLTPRTATVKETALLAEKNSTYSGPATYRRLIIREHLELYFRVFVFATSDIPPEHYKHINHPDGEGLENRHWSHIHPQIQLWPVDRSRREGPYNSLNHGAILGSEPPRESFRRVWREKIVACGKSALRRLTPSRAARYGFHGELLWSDAVNSHMKPDIVIECRETICCFSDSYFYIIADHDTVTRKGKDPKRDFPLPISELATFKDAIWPHALVSHCFQDLDTVTIGFGFQRLLLKFTDPHSEEDFVYVVLTSNKLETISLLKDIQELCAAVNEPVFGTQARTTLRIENDDPHVLIALAAAVAPDPVGVVIHYQILEQRWKSGGRGTVRRVCVVTDEMLFLLDEDYVGDGAESTESILGKDLGQSVNRLVDSAHINQIGQVLAADADPKYITIVMKSSVLKRSHNWRLLCRDAEGAEKLVESVRKAISQAI